MSPWRTVIATVTLAVLAACGSSSPSGNATSKARKLASQLDRLDQQHAPAKTLESIYGNNGATACKTATEPIAVAAMLDNSVAVEDDIRFTTAVLSVYCPAKLERYATIVEDQYGDDIVTPTLKTLHRSR